MYRTKSILNFDFKKLSPYLPFILFTSVYLLGVLFGTLLVGTVQTYNEIGSELFSNFYNTRQNTEILSIVKQSSYYIFLPYFVIFLFGTSIVGCFFVPIVVLLTGLRIGLLSGYMYITHKLFGIMLHSLILLVPALIGLYGLVLIGIEAFVFSKRLSVICIIPNKHADVSYGFKSYCIRSAITLIAALLSVVLDLCFSLLFISYFQL